MEVHGLPCPRARELHVPTESQNSFSPSPPPWAVCWCCPLALSDTRLCSMLPSARRTGWTQQADLGLSVTHEQCFSTTGPCPSGQRVPGGAHAAGLLPGEKGPDGPLGIRDGVLGLLGLSILEEPALVRPHHKGPFCFSSCPACLPSVSSQFPILRTVTFTIVENPSLVWEQRG